MESQTASLTTQNVAAQKQQVFTFFVQDMMFGLSVDNVLMLDQNISMIQPVPVEEQGFCGVIKFQGVVVPVLDFAHRLGIRSGMDAKKALISTLKQRETEHQQWFQSLNESLQQAQGFHLDLDAADCDASLWYRHFDSRDDTLNDLIKAFIEPHQQLHEAGMLAVRQAQGQTPEHIAGVFRQQAGPHLQKIHSLTQRAKDQVESDMRQVLLFVTDDGKTPRYALLIDEINDVISYDAAEFQSSTSGALAQIRKIREVLAGIFSRDNAPDCLFFDIDKLADEQWLETSQY
jgi:chemotaxis signal transduction protein